MPVPFLSTSDAEVLACADCAARLANGQPVPMYNTGWPLSLRCEHERTVDAESIPAETDHARSDEARLTAAVRDMIQTGRAIVDAS